MLAISDILAIIIRDFIKKQLISFDIDGVIVDTAFHAIKLFNHRFKQNKKTTDLTSFFIIYEWICEILNDDKLALQEAIKIWNNEDVLSKSPPMKGAQELTKKLLDEGNEVHYITSRPNFVRQITYDWFQKWLPWVRIESIHISPDTNGLQRSFKVEKIKDMKPSIHFEDSLEHAGDISKASPGMVRQPWNYAVTETLPEAIIMPKVKRNLLSSYEYYLKTL